MSKILLSVFLAICAAIVFVLLDEQRHCTESGGVYVRTMYGYTCIGNP